MSERLNRKTFEDFYLSNGMLETLSTIGYEQPTPVQSATIPLVMAGIDLIVQSQTGTGKTAAFAIPAVEMLEPAPGTVEMLVLTPTRELAKQVSDEFARLGSFKGINVATIYGGTSYGPQYDALESAHIVVATPGRLLDIADRGNLDLSNLRIFALDEADEMLSMGFQEEVDAIIAKLPEERQSLLFSATITSEVKALGKNMLYYPEFITLSSDSVAAEDVSHEYYPVSGVGRARDLLKVLEHEEPENAIVFANTRDDTFTVTTFLKRHGLRAEVLNGDLPQKERERTLAALRKGEIDFLVATDVAARGIDISDLSHVINYTVPDSAEVYIHRTGRTGRAGKKGKAVSLISPREMATLFNIRKHYGVNMKKRELPTPNDILEAKKARRIAQLNDKLASVDELTYGGALGLARQLVRDSESLGEIDRIRFVARLIALAEQLGKGVVPPVAEAAPAAPNGDHPVNGEAAYEEPEEELSEVSEATQAQPQADEEPSDRRGRRRGRRGRRDRDERDRRENGEDSDEREEVEEVRAQPEAKEAEEAEERPRRRRRRHEEREEREEREEEPEVAKAAPEEREEREEPRRERSRRRRRGRDRDRDRSEEGETRASREEPRERSKPEAAPEPEEAMSKLWVNIGRNHFEAPEEVVEMICFMAGMDPDDLGSVTLGNSFSYVEVRKDYFYDIINALNNQDWNGVTVAAEPARK